MAYYPSSQIKANLYTNGGEFQVALTREMYIGYYWTLSNNKFFSGKTPQDELVFEIIPYSKIDQPNLSINQNKYPTLEIALPDESISAYTLLSNPLYNQSLVRTYINNKRINQTPLIIPTYSPTLPTQQDYQNGEMRRYFCKKTNEVIYLEINKETYDKLVKQDPQILWQLYLPFNLPWQLTGNKEDVYKTNKNITELTSFRLKLPMLSKYLKDDFTKYYK